MLEWIVPIIIVVILVLYIAKMFLGEKQLLSLQQIQQQAEQGLSQGAISLGTEDKISTYEDELILLQDLQAFEKKVTEREYALRRFLLEMFLDKNPNPLRQEFNIQDYQEEAELFVRANEEEDIQAQFSLGARYEDGLGVPQDFEKAVYWYEKAAEQGHDLAQHSLGSIYVRVFEDFEKALYWFQKAAEQGDLLSQHFLDTLLAKGPSALHDSSKQNSKKMAELFVKAVEEEDAQAQHNLGMMYFYGQEEPQDFEKALYWFQKAAAQGEAQSQYFLGAMYHQGQAVPQNFEKAIYWFLKAAEQRNPSAQFSLGKTYEHGQGVPQDFKKAVHWFQQAAEQGNASAQYSLARMYVLGQGVQEDIEKAYLWTILAAEQGEQNAIKGKDILAKDLTPQQIEEAYKMLQAGFAAPPRKAPVD